MRPWFPRVAAADIRRRGPCGETEDDDSNDWEKAERELTMFGAKEEDDATAGNMD